MRMFLLLIVIYHHNLQCKGLMRIYGGRDALRGEFPYVVRIEKHTTVFLDGEMKTDIRQRCTGAALTPSWILSAAHCINKDDFSNKSEKLVARYNSYFPKYVGETKTIFEVKIHPTYNFEIDDFDPVDSFKNDLCLFRSEGILVDRYGKLSSVDFRSLIGHEAYSLGFGATNASEFEKPLQVLKGMLYDCTEDINTHYIYKLCLMPQCGLQNTICGGDSGGPIVHGSGIVGVNSESAGDCDEHSTSLNLQAGTEAAILSTVSGSLDWISNIIDNS